MAHTLRFGVATADHQCEAYDGHDDIRDVWERVGFGYQIGLDSDPALRRTPTDLSRAYAGLISE